MEHVLEINDDLQDVLPKDEVEVADEDEDGGGGPAAATAAIPSPTSKKAISLDDSHVLEAIRLLEQEKPPLKFKMCIDELIYSQCINSILKNIATDDDYDVYSIENWYE